LVSGTHWEKIPKNINFLGCILTKTEENHPKKLVKKILVPYSYDRNIHPLPQKYSMNMKRLTYFYRDIWDFVSCCLFYKYKKKLVIKFDKGSKGHDYKSIIIYIIVTSHFMAPIKNLLSSNSNIWKIIAHKIPDSRSFFLFFATLKFNFKQNLIFVGSVFSRLSNSLDVL
jgi:hypothetical protein